MKSWKIKEKKTGIFWKNQNRFVRVFCGYKGEYWVGLKTYGKGNQTELLSGLKFFYNIKDVIEFLNVNSNKKIELIEDIQKENKERAEQELSLNLKHSFPNYTEKEFWNFIEFLYGGKFEKVFAELQN